MAIAVLMFVDGIGSRNGGGWGSAAAGEGTADDVVEHGKDIAGVVIVDDCADVDVVDGAVDNDDDDSVDGKAAGLFDVVGGNGSKNSGKV